MPVELRWHPKLPVLLATYTGVISVKDYYAMCDGRLDMLRKGPDRAILLADVQSLEGFPDLEPSQRGENILLHEKIARTLIVLDSSFFRRLSRSMVPDPEQTYPVRLFSTVEEALVEAKTLSSQLG
ncbi:MAG TPA: hypothetical protein VMT24_12040 [Aggregatilineaceae bacterium]|nr:hypothetical protein [Aggregatilineaceae bacterium]